MNDRLLIIGGHPDDPACWGGTLSRFCRERWKIKIYTCMDGNDEHVKAYAPWCDEMVANPAKSIDSSEEGGKFFWDLVNLVKDWKPTVIITHDAGDRFPSHRFIAEQVQEAAYMANRNGYLRGEMQCWGGDADWEGPLIQQPSVVVRISAEDLKAKIKMLADTAKMHAATEHFTSWSTSLAKFRSVAILEDNGLAEAYRHYQPRII